jgi:hypothetical protein
MAKQPNVKSTLPELGNYRTTGINLPTPIWELLNRIAFERARKYGGRPSVSKLLVDLVERHRKELEKELAESSR